MYFGLHSCCRVTVSVQTTTQYAMEIFTENKHMGYLMTTSHSLSFSWPSLCTFSTRTLITSLWETVILPFLFAFVGRSMSWLSGISRFNESVHGPGPVHSCSCETRSAPCCPMDQRSSHMSAYSGEPSRFSSERGSIGVSLSEHFKQQRTCEVGSFAPLCVPR